MSPTHGAALQISEGEGYTFDTIAWVETVDLACEVGVEHNRSKLGDAVAKVPISLRVTTVFRREDDGWKIVHRHADPITTADPCNPWSGHDPATAGRCWR